VNMISTKRNIIFTFFVLALLAAGNIMAGDGDVSYTSPYITVDPATGKLITVNPGPELKMHDGMSMPTTSSSPELANPIGVSGATSNPDNSGDSNRSRIVTIAIGLIAGLGIVVFLVGRVRKQKNISV